MTRLRHHLRRALIATACAFLLGTAAMVASGDGPGRTTRGDMGMPITARPAFHLRTPSDLLPDPTCIKCNGGPIEVLSDADIQRAGDDAALLVLSMREERGIGLPVFGDVPWHGWEVGSVGLPTMTVASTTWSGGPGGLAPDGVVIRLPVSAVPEPGAWLTLLVGFGAVGAVLRRKAA